MAKNWCATGSEAVREVKAGSLYTAPIGSPQTREREQEVLCVVGDGENSNFDSKLICKGATSVKPLSV
jgi:hypothetical protein